MTLQPGLRRMGRAGARLVRGWLALTLALALTPCCGLVTSAFGTPAELHHMLDGMQRHGHQAPMSAPRHVCDQWLNTAPVVPATSLHVAAIAHPVAFIPASDAHAFTPGARGFVVASLAIGHGPPSRIPPYLLNAHLLL